MDSWNSNRFVILAYAQHNQCYNLKVASIIRENVWECTDDDIYEPLTFRLYNRCSTHFNQIKLRKWNIKLEGSYRVWLMQPFTCSAEHVIGIWCEVSCTITCFTNNLRRSIGGCWWMICISECSVYLHYRYNGILKESNR